MRLNCSSLGLGRCGGPLGLLSRGILDWLGFSCGWRTAAGGSFVFFGSIGGLLILAGELGVGSFYDFWTISDFS